MKKISTTFLCCAAFALPAKAELLTYNFTASIDRLSESWHETQSATFAGHTFTLGEKVKGILTYNTATPRSWLQPEPDRWSTQAAYGGANFGNTITLTYEKSNLTFKFNVPRIEVRDGIPDLIGFTGDGDATNTTMRLASYLLSSTNLPERLPTYFPNSPSNFMIYDVNQYLGSGNTSVNITSRINSFDLMPTTPVPEPATYAMLLAGVAGVGLAARRRARR